MSYRRILGRVDREEFVGRDSELERVVQHSSRGAGGLWLLAAPTAGVSELVRQAFDRLFGENGEIVPFHFAFGHRERHPVDAARRFFNAFLQQFVAYRRGAAAMCDAPLSLDELIHLALPADTAWLEDLVNTLEHLTDDEALTRFCFGAPNRAAAAGWTIFPIIDATHAVDDLDASITQLCDLFGRSGTRYVLAGARRGMLNVVCETEQRPGAGEVLHLERLDDRSAQRLAELTARRYGVEVNAATADLLVQQLEANPFLISALIQAARDRQMSLSSFLNCQRIYIDEIMGGRMNRYFSVLLEHLAPNPETRHTLSSVLYESVLGGERKQHRADWKKQLKLDASEFSRLVNRLHVSEVVNASGEFIELPPAAHPLNDFLRANYLEHAANEPRALVLASMLQHALKRAPRAMARKYRREAAMGLKELLAEFNCQTVPAKLFHYNRFAEHYGGMSDVETESGLAADADLLRVPQVVSVAPASAFAPKFECDEERCAVAHAFDAGDYTDASEMVLIAIEIESKLEAGRELTQEWLTRVTKLAADLNLNRVRFWLVANEGFSAKACELLEKHNAFNSSRRQVELLSVRVKGGAVTKKDRGDENEYDLVVPMGEDSELIAAQAVEQIARRAKFKPAAINQIKTALVEASINAFEHSLSPDRKLYHRFRLDDDKLVITVASRGVVPAAIAGGEGAEASVATRRGWGLKLIRSLMDEVEFQPVDDGTELRMVKYRKH